MIDLVTCIRCSKPIYPNAHLCSNCGFDLDQTTEANEKAVSYTPAVPGGLPLIPEILVPRLGDYLIEKGVLCIADLETALKYQQQQAELGEPVLIGQALLALDLIDQESLDEAVTEQILELQSALHRANHQLEQRVQERTAELSNALEKLTELSRLKSNFVSNISHELRTPLTHIKGYLDMLSEESLGPLTTHQSDALKVLLRAEARLERLIEDLIQFSIASRGDLSIRPEPFYLTHLLNISISQTRNIARENHLQLTCSIPEKLPQVMADESKISWVLTQLLDNAVKFTPEGGRISIEAELEKDSILISVADTGIGIAEERLSEIFEPFHQLDGSITRQYAGTGLGLTMAYRILETHGTSLNVESTVGKGSRFTFLLPTANNNYD